MTEAAAMVNVRKWGFQTDEGLDHGTTLVCAECQMELEPLTDDEPWTINELTDVLQQHIIEAHTRWWEVSWAEINASAIVQSDKPAGP